MTDFAYKAATSAAMTMRQKLLKALEESQSSVGPDEAVAMLGYLAGQLATYMDTEDEDEDVVAFVTEVVATNIERGYIDTLAMRKKPSGTA